MATSVFVTQQPGLLLAAEPWTPVVRACPFSCFHGDVRASQVPGGASADMPRSATPPCREHLTNAVSSMLPSSPRKLSALGIKRISGLTPQPISSLFTLR